LAIEYQAEGVFGRPVTFVFVPSTHLPNLRNTSTLSNLFSTLRFFAFFVLLP
jgi:hypothetical protein